MSEAGNTSHAVRAQRHEALDSLDDFPTPPWATRAFLGQVLDPWLRATANAYLSDLSAWEPACNRGYMARPLAERFAGVHASDIADYGWTGQSRVADFLTERGVGGRAACDWIITNPPFVHAAAFALKCLELRPRMGFALFCRSSFLEGGERNADLFAANPPALVVQHAERVPIVRGRFDPQASTATSYSWFVWRTDREPGGDPAIKWIAPCRDRYERPDDVGFETRDGRDWIADACAATPLFAGGT
jgi:hypothetical protein